MPAPQEPQTSSKTLPTVNDEPSTNGVSAVGTEHLGDSSTPLDNNNVIGKRKRSSSSEHQLPQKQKTMIALDEAGDSVGVSNEEKARRQKQAIARISKELLVVLKENDPIPSVLKHSLGSIATSTVLGSPPIKRTRLNEPIPDTIYGRLSAGAYTSLGAFVLDVSTACRDIINRSSGLRMNNMVNGSSSWDGGNTAVARTVYFERLAKDLVNRERRREANILDFVEELEWDNQIKEFDGSDKVALTVMAHHGPLFSSLPKPQSVILLSMSSSRSSSTSGSPKSTISTPATSVLDEPEIKTEEITVNTPFIEALLPPLISTVKAISSNQPQTTSSKKLIEPLRALTIGETFPPAPSLPPLQLNKYERPIYGLKWGGDLGYGGVSTNNVNDMKTEPSGHWLQYLNTPHPGRNRWVIDPYRQGIGLPPLFVAAYSSFAPSRDESMAKVPASLRNSIWWEQKGGNIFRKFFAKDPEIGHMFKDYEKPATTELVVGRAASEILEMDEKEIEKAIENYIDDKPIPVDTRLLNGQNSDISVAAEDEDTMDADAILTEISSLLTTLQSQQYNRFASDKPQDALDPTEEECETYHRLSDRLTFLISTLPPHLTATVDGHPDSDLALSKIIPLSTGHPVFKGTLPSDDSPRPPPQVQAAAMNAMNAAAGMSPLNNTVPVAPQIRLNTSQQMQTPVRVQSAPYLTANSGTPGYHTPQPAPYTQYHGQTTPHHYTMPYNSGSYVQTPHQIGSVTPQPQSAVMSPSISQQQPVPAQTYYGGHTMNNPSTPAPLGTPTPAQGYMYQGTPVPNSMARPRVGAPPPQGLAAVGVSSVYQTGYTNQVTPGTPNRYSQRARR